MNILYVLMDYRNGKWIPSLSRILLVIVLTVALFHFPTLPANWLTLILALLAYCFGSKRLTPNKEIEKQE